MVAVTIEYLDFSRPITDIMKMRNEEIWSETFVGRVKLMVERGRNFPIEDGPMFN